MEHKTNLHNRLAFDKFLDEIALEYFQSPRNFVVEELIDKICKSNKELIIDGLDHVENYRPLELPKFVDFINKLDEGKVVVLSRPLKMQIPWEKIELTNWSYEETSKYLSEAYRIVDYDVETKIFDITDGYPIITYYIAEHYILNREICAVHKISDLNNYYDNLLSDSKTNSLMTLFATNNSFFTNRELDILLESGELADAVRNFITQHPYLFSFVENRIALIHDSLNTYLRILISKYPERLKSVNSIVQASILAGKVEYMARMGSFAFDDEFYDQLLKKYSDEDILENILKNTIDINSVSSFYNQLQQLLERRKNVLSIYQYYSFSLIYEMLERNDTTEYEGIIYQVLRYIKYRNGNICDFIYSSGAIWNFYILLRGNHENDYRRYLKNRKYADYHINSVIDTINSEYVFFDKNENIIDQKVFDAKIGGSNSDLEKKDLLIVYLVNVWIHRNQENEYFDVVERFVKGYEEDAMEEFERLVSKYKMENMWWSSVLFAVRYQLHQLGFFGEDNWFRNKSLKEQIEEKAPEGSFSISDYILSFIRLANEEKREIDICSVNLYWIMYQMRKDYTVYNIDDALIVFENHGLIDEMHSLEIIKRVMKQSEKGIRHLMSSYVNSKPMEFTVKLAQMNYFRASDCPLDIFDLDAKHINCCTKEQFIDAMWSWLNYHSYNRTMEYGDISNAICSQYGGVLLSAMDYYGYSVYGSEVDNYVKKKFDEMGIRCLVKEKENDNLQYIPFEHGCIHKEDKEYIKESGMSYLDIARFTDGWDSCLPYVSLFLEYDLEDIKRDYLQIIHTSMFARTVSLQRIGLWFLLVGNIPKFLDTVEIEIDWEKMFKIFLHFLRLSMIWY